jgi:meso-butanediol dehydrogenase/(S,S)-butanediol dehydrogenase/diacetyl reductase
MYDLSGKVALVTGAGGERGFGRAIANRLAEDGADVAVNDVMAIPYGGGWNGVDAVVEEIKAKGMRSIAVIADVSDGNAVQAMVDDVVAQFGRIDIFVANAGSRPGPDRVPVVELTEEAFDEVMRVNVRGTFLTCQAVARHMIERGGDGKIVIISSTAGKRGLPRYAAYTASKFALVGFTQSFAHEMGAYKVNVNAICPGLAETERVIHIAGALRGEGQTAEDHLAEMVRQRSAVNPLGRITETRDIANMAAFLASSEADYLAGLAISVSGGDVMF